MMKVDGSGHHEGSDHAASLLAEAIGSLGVPSEPQSTDDYLALIAAASTMESQAREQLHNAVVSARGAGVTWSAVGKALGMSKQAAQKRFAVSVAPVQSNLNPDERIVGPVTTFDEMAELDLAGRYGWHSVDFGPFHHRVIRSSTQWEHKRTSMLRTGASALSTEGWQLIKSQFPFSYWKRDRGIPALKEQT